MKKYKNLGKNVLLFSISSLIPKLLAFILIPIYTSKLSTVSYGKIELVTTTVSLLIPIITLNISDALLRFLLDKKYNNKDVFSSCMYILIYDVLLSFLLLSALVIFDPFNIEKVYYIFFSVFMILNIFYNIMCIYLKGLELIKNMVIGSIINSLVTFVLMITFLTVYDLGVIGYVLGSTLGLFISIIYMFFATRCYKNFNFKINRSVFKEMVKYSFPMIFSAIAWWINNSSDRYIIAIISGVGISGVYAVASKIPHILKTFQNIFLQAWSISAIKEFDKNDEDGFIGNMFSVMNLIMIIGCSFLILFNIFISKLLYSGDFFIAWKYVPPLLVSVIFDSLALFIGNIYYAVKDTKTLSIANVIGAIINILLNIVLIKLIGAYGAAISTAISYFITFVLCFIYLKKYINMKTNSQVLFLGYILIVIQMIVAYFGNKFFVFEFLIFVLLLFNYRIYYKSFIKILNDFFKRKRKEIKND